MTRRLQVVAVSVLGRLVETPAFGLAAAFATAVLTMGGIYRAELYSAVFTAEAPPFGLLLEQHKVVRYAVSELRFALAAGLIAGVLVALATRSWWPWSPRRVLAAARVVLAGALLAMAVGTHTHLYLVLGTNEGLTLETVLAAVQSISVGGFFGQWSGFDLAFAAVVLGVFLVLSFPSPRKRRALAGVWAAAVVAAILLAALDHGKSLPARAQPLRNNPIVFLFRDALRPPSPVPPGWHDPKAAPTRADPWRVPAPTDPVASPPAPDQPLNVLVIIAESTGAAYALSPVEGGDVPMPFVASLTAESLLLTEHYTVNNSSPRSIFSIFSGLYPYPDRRLFSTLGSVRVPSLFSFLDDRYDSFLVTPGDLGWYFPKPFLHNTGLVEMHDRHDIEPAAPRDSPPFAVNELDAVDYFLARLGQATPPFAAVYYSFAPHYDYFDYGPEFAVLTDPNNKLHRYINNLRMLDTQIERIVRHLEQRNLVSTTLLLIVGDHGEAFGQHPGNWAHTRELFQENLRTLALVSNPPRLDHRVVTTPTSHVDLLPTILDAVGVPYDSRLFQGQSLLRSGPARDYIFFVSNADRQIGSLGSHGTKVVASFRQGRVWAYDLEADPQEQHRLDANRFREQVHALFRFKRYQQRFLDAYNDAITRGEAFDDARH